MIVRFSVGNASEAMIVSDELGLPRIKDIAFELVMGENYTLKENESYCQLRKLDSCYAGLEGMIGLQPLEVMLLPNDTLSGVYLNRRADGAALAHFKAPHATLMTCLKLANHFG